MRADEVEHCAVALVGRLPEPSSELLEEQGRALGRPEHENGVEDGDVDALVEQVDGEDDVDPPGGEVLQRALAIRVRAVAPDGDGSDAMGVEVPRHELGVFDAHAEAEATHGRWVCVPGHLLDDEAGPGVGARVHVGERRRVVATPPPPRDLSKVEPVVDPVVQERREVLLVDRVPQAEFCGDAVVEPLEDRQPIAALGRGGESE